VRAREMKRVPLQGLSYRQVDVFARDVLSGNGVAVFWNCGEMPTETMQELARELRQFEAIFLSAAGPHNEYRARVFTMEEELDFAGHPVLGAAAVLHEKYGHMESETWRIVLNSGTTEVSTQRMGRSYVAAMTQPQAQFLGPIGLPSEIETLMHAVGLEVDVKHPELPLEVGSTGLAYLIVPIIRNLEKARIVADNMEEMLKRIGARFVYIYDVEKSEGRNWDNRGLVEDIATGSAAGPVAAYLCRHGFLDKGQELRIRQGRFAGRPSEMAAKVLITDQVEVSGAIHMVASGSFD
jgi:trans-2,3-dihydro-3-hydroxyanthranilate isomerase